MPTYVSLVSWTEQGIRAFPDTIRRAEEFSRFVQGSGGKVRETLWTCGPSASTTLSKSPSSPMMRWRLRPFSGSDQAQAH